MSDLYEKSLQAHLKSRGKLAVKSKVPLETPAALARFYAPGVSGPCRAIAEQPDLVYDLTSKWNTVAVITDGSSVMGLGDIGARASLPAMEGKCLMFKRFACIDAYPLVLDTQNTDEIIRTISLLTGSLGGINLEDIAAPRCFEIEERLQQICDIPVFHDDQHGMAIVTVAGLMNALKLAGKKLEKVRLVLNGSGAGATAIVRLLLAFGARRIVVCDNRGAVYRGRPGRIDWAIEELANMSNPDNETGQLEDLLKGADIFLGFSEPGLVTGRMIKSMAKKPIILALGHPQPEIDPQEAKKAGALVVATSLYDYPNQLNRSLGFPGIFRGALDVRARLINDEMKIAAAKALTTLIPDNELNPDYIIPSVFNPEVVPAIAAAVAQAARETEVARI